MLNKYHQEYFQHGDQRKALERIIRKIGIVTLITNFTTAVGFLVLAFTDIVVLREFGVIAGVNILATFRRQFNHDSGGVFIFKATIK